MSDGQRTTLDLLIVLAILIIFASHYGKGFWQTLFTKHEYKVDAFKWPSLNVNPLTGKATVGG